MRITAGSYGGRPITVPAGTQTRPMTDKVRAAVFDALGDVVGLSVLDAYAGSGAIGFEALSRGATNVVAIEPAKAAVVAIQQNQQHLEASWGYSLYETTCESYLARVSTPHQFDVVIDDPPYDQLKADVLEKLAGLLNGEGVFVLSHSSKLKPKLEGLHHIKTKNYGDSALSFYNR